MDLFAPRTRAARIALGIGLAVGFAGLTVVGANIVIPIQPVPITLQTLFVLLAGASIGRGWGTLSQALYVGLGAAGLPLFAGGASGLALLGGPTGGYLLSFLIAPFIVGALLRRSSRIAWQAASFAIGTVVILALGVTHLTVFYTHDVGQALTLGVLPFLPGAVFKITAAVSIYRSSQALARHYRARRDPA
ncbi:MAG TPA: biotin transporter BioY [Candidatus Krumholzibacteria bacterium]|nr:biotin transporter BioY [Candidatus Krumholzibacteria bacterium]